MILFPSLRIFVEITDTQSRIAAGVSNSFTDDHCSLTAGGLQKPMACDMAYCHTPKPCMLQARAPEKPFEDVLSKPVGPSFEEKNK